MSEKELTNDAVEFYQSEFIDLLREGFQSCGVTLKGQVISGAVLGPSKCYKHTPVVLVFERDLHPNVVIALSRVLVGALKSCIDNDIPF